MLCNTAFGEAGDRMESVRNEQRVRTGSGETKAVKTLLVIDKDSLWGQQGWALISPDPQGG